jgi:cytochrome P450
VIWLKPRGLNQLLGFMMPKEVHRYNKFVADNVAMAIKEPLQGSRGSILYSLSLIKDPGHQKPALSSEELLSEAHLLNIAGRDTTAITTSALFFYLCHNARVYDRVTHEIRSKFSTPQSIYPGRVLSSCHYLRACINEALRMAPPGTSEYPRKVLRPGAMIDGNFYPEGVVVGSGAWATGYNQTLYGDPEKYRPERWIVCEETGPSEEEVDRLKAGFHPFFQGPGKCPGQQIAMTELMMIVGRTLFRTDVRLLPGSNVGAGVPSLGWGRTLSDQYQLEDAYMAIRKGPLVQFRRRVI